MEERLKAIEAELAELKAWRGERLTQQLAYPVDEASKNALGAATYVGKGGHDLTQNKSIGSVPMSITVPAAYAGTVIIRVNGTSYEIPYL